MSVHDGMYASRLGPTPQSHVKVKSETRRALGDLNCNVANADQGLTVKKKRVGLSDPRSASKKHTDHGTKMAPSSLRRAGRSDRVFGTDFETPARTERSNTNKLRVHNDEPQTPASLTAPSPRVTPSTTTDGKKRPCKMRLVRMVEVTKKQLDYEERIRQLTQLMDSVPLRYYLDSKTPEAEKRAYEKMNRIFCLNHFLNNKAKAREHLQFMVNQEIGLQFHNTWDLWMNRFCDTKAELDEVYERACGHIKESERDTLRERYEAAVASKESSKPEAASLRTPLSAMASRTHAQDDDARRGLSSAKHRTKPAPTLMRFNLGSAMRVPTNTHVAEKDDDSSGSVAADSVQAAPVQRADSDEHNRQPVSSIVPTLAPVQDQRQTQTPKERKQAEEKQTPKDEERAESKEQQETPKDEQKAKDEAVVTPTAALDGGSATSTPTATIELPDVKEEEFQCIDMTQELALKMELPPEGKESPHASAFAALCKSSKHCKKVGDQQYVYIRMLGRGGSSKVYEALDCHFRKVAIKQVLVQFDSEENRVRLFYFS